jgi:hypothetical protein
MFEKYCSKNTSNNGNDVFQDAILVFTDSLHVQDYVKTYIPLGPIHNRASRKVLFLSNKKKVGWTISRPHKPTRLHTIVSLRSQRGHHHNT